MSEIQVECVVFTRDEFEYARIGDQVRRMRTLGMTLRAIGAELGVDEGTVRKALGRK